LINRLACWINEYVRSHFEGFGIEQLEQNGWVLLEPVEALFQEHTDENQEFLHAAFIACHIEIHEAQKVPRTIRHCFVSQNELNYLVQSLLLDFYVIILSTKQKTQLRILNFNDFVVYLLQIKSTIWFLTSLTLNLTSLTLNLTLNWVAGDDIYNASALIQQKLLLVLLYDGFKVVNQICANVVQYVFELELVVESASEEQGRVVVHNIADQVDVFRGNQCLLADDLLYYYFLVLFNQWIQIQIGVVWFVSLILVFLHTNLLQLFVYHDVVEHLVICEVLLLLDDDVVETILEGCNVVVQQ